MPYLGGAVFIKKIFAYSDKQKIVLLTDDAYFVSQRFDHYVKTEYSERKVDFKGNQFDINRYMRKWLNNWDEVIIVANDKTKARLLYTLEKAPKKFINPMEVKKEWKE